MRMVTNIFKSSSAGFLNIRQIYRDYFMVGEGVRFLFTSELLQTNE